MCEMEDIQCKALPLMVSKDEIEQCIFCDFFIPRTCLKIDNDHNLVFKQIFMDKLFGGCTIHTLVTLLLNLDRTLSNVSHFYLIALTKKY